MVCASLSDFSQFEPHFQQQRQSFACFRLWALSAMQCQPVLLRLPWIGREIWTPGSCLYVGPTRNQLQSIDSIRQVGSVFSLPSTFDALRLALPIFDPSKVEALVERRARCARDLPGPQTNGYGSKVNHQKTAGFSPCFHLLGFHLGYPFLTQTQRGGPGEFDSCGKDLN